MTSEDFERIGEQAADEVIEVRSNELSKFAKACSLMRGALRRKPDIEVSAVQERPVVAAAMEQHGISLATLRQAATKVRKELKAQQTTEQAAELLQVSRRRKADTKSNSKTFQNQPNCAGEAASSQPAELPLSTRPGDRRAHHSAEGL